MASASASATRAWSNPRAETSSARTPANRAGVVSGSGPAAKRASESLRVPRASLFSAAKRVSRAFSSLSVAANTELAPALSIITPRSATALRSTSRVRLAPARLAGFRGVCESETEAANRGAVSGAAEVANVTALRVVGSLSATARFSFRALFFTAASSRSRTSAAWRRAASLCFVFPAGAFFAKLVSRAEE